MFEPVMWFSTSCTSNEHTINKSLNTIFCKYWLIEASSGFSYYYKYYLVNMVHFCRFDVAYLSIFLTLRHFIAFQGFHLIQNWSRPILIPFKKQKKILTKKYFGSRQSSQVEPNIVVPKGHNGAQTSSRTTLQCHTLPQKATRRTCKPCDADTLSVKKSAGKIIHKIHAFLFIRKSGFGWLHKKKNKRNLLPFLFTLN